MHTTTHHTIFARAEMNSMFQETNYPCHSAFINTPSLPPLRSAENGHFRFAVPSASAVKNEEKIRIEKKQQVPQLLSLERRIFLKKKGSFQGKTQRDGTRERTKRKKKHVFLSAVKASQSLSGPPLSPTPHRPPPQKTCILVFPSPTFIEQSNSFLLFPFPPELLFYRLDSGGGGRGGGGGG